MNNGEYGRLVRFFVERGLQASKEAIDVILDKKINLVDLIHFVEDKHPLIAVITPSIITDFENAEHESGTINDELDRQIRMEIQEKAEFSKKSPPNDEIKLPLVPMELLIVPPILRTRGKVLDFARHYTDRYSKIVNIFVENNKDLLSNKQIPLISDFGKLTQMLVKAREAGNKVFDVVVSGIVSEVHQSHDSITVYLQGVCKPPLIIGKFKKDTAAAKNAAELPLGVVIGIQGTPVLIPEKFPVLEAKAIVYPDIATVKAGVQSPPSYVDLLLLAISDLQYNHQYAVESYEKNLKSIKSKTYVLLDVLITAINQAINRNRFGRIAAIIFSGNVIDSTNSNLSVKDQYTSLVKKLSKLNPSITIILTPGETDFTREFLPQPRPHEKYLPELPPNISFLDNPACFNLLDRTILVFHDKNALKVLKPNEEIDFMVKLLRFRYLAPKWPNTSSVVLPALEDPLVITHRPDIFILSSVNTATVGRYKDVRLVTAMNLKEYRKMLTEDELLGEGLLEISLPATSLNSLESRVINLRLAQKS